MSAHDRSVDVAGRQNPVKIVGDRVYRKTITIRYPMGWALVSALNDVRLKTNSAVYPVKANGDRYDFSEPGGQTYRQ